MPNVHDEADRYAPSLQTFRSDLHEARSRHLTMARSLVAESKLSRSEARQAAAGPIKQRFLARKEGRLGDAPFIICVEQPL